MRVGFIGLGNQGGPMARRVALSETNSLTLWARRDAALDPYRDTAAEFAKTPAELAAKSEVISVCVFSDQDVEQVVLGTDGVLEGAAPDSVIAIHSTVSPRLILELAEKAAEKDVHLLDAPVSGGGAAAEAGALLVMVGSSPELFERCSPAFAPYGKPLVHVGPLGSGQLAKLLNNTLLTAHLGLADDTVALAENLGLNAAALIEVITHGSGNSFGFGMLQRSGTVAAMGQGAGPYLFKDVNLLEEAATTRGVDAHSLIGPADRGLVALQVPRT
ncbi:NAD(P)-dependent oxidoreductase [Jatrophihabitans sp. DSM 45814]